MVGRGQVRSVTDGFFRSKKGFTVVQNEITRDRDISLKAKGLYLVIQANITMPDKRWRKEDFKSMTCEGKKAFDGAWNELKEAGYLKVHMYSNGVTWTVEYELLDEPAAGAHTFYYNSKGELTKTNLERAVAKSINVGSDVENDEENPEKEENFRIPPFGSNGNGSNGNRYNGNGYNGNGYNGDGSNGNGGNNNKDLITNPNFKDSDINTSIKSYHKTSKETLESQNKIDKDSTDLEILLLIKEVGDENVKGMLIAQIKATVLYYKK